MRQFIKVKNGNTVGAIINEGGIYNGKRYGAKSPDSKYIEGGLYPIIDSAKPSYNPKTQKLTVVDTFTNNEVTRTYSVEPLPVDVKTQNRYRELERIFNEKIDGISKLAISKSWATDERYIANQEKLYAYLRDFADMGLFDATYNQEVIDANNQAKQLMAAFVKLINDVRGVVELAIENDTTDVDQKLMDADAISLNAVDLTPTKLAEIQTMFGL